MPTYDTSYEGLIEKLRYLPDIKTAQRAYEYALDAHKDQRRHSGELYITHPLGVAHILAELEMDEECIAAGLLHDVIEDVEKDSYETIEQEFGETIAQLVEGVTKLDKIPFVGAEERQIENLRRMFLAMASDIRVIIIKLADRLHNMRTLLYMTDEKKREKARETLEVYAPLAHRLGLQRIKWELEDLALRYLDSVAYYEIVDSVNQKRTEREEYLEQIVNGFKEKLADMNLKADIYGRVKHYYSIYRKMFTQDKTIDEIYDLFAIRIIVDSINDCYAALGMVHEAYKPIPGRVKDYIAMPKPNMYQSLHTTLIGPEGHPFEVQIRTHQMHRVAEYGVAAHWKYKEGKTDGKATPDDTKLAWVREMLEMQKETEDSRDFMQLLKIDLFSDEVFVFTPKGEVLSLPLGATPIDFAFMVHSAVGYRMVGAKVNSKIVPIDYKLQNGDIVEVLTSSVMNGPKLDWLKVCKTASARTKINQWFKKEKREENFARGKEALDKEIKKGIFTEKELFVSPYTEQMLKRYRFNSMEDMYVSIGASGMGPNRIIQKLTELNPELRQRIKEQEAQELAEKMEQTPKKRSSSGSGVIIKGEDGLLVRLSKCCNPVQGDKIVGFITRGRGVSVHRADCANVAKDHLTEEMQGRIVECEWDNVEAATFFCNLQLEATDRQGLLGDITGAISELKMQIGAFSAQTKNNVAVIKFELEIHNKEQIEFVMKRLHRIPGVYDVYRVIS